LRTERSATEGQSIEPGRGRQMRASWGIRVRVRSRRANAPARA